MDRYSFIEVDLHHKLLAGLPAHSLALRPAHSRRHLYVTSYTEGFSHFVTSMTAPVASGWSGWPGGLRTHWKAPPCHGAHVHRTFVAEFAHRLDPTTAPLRAKLQVPYCRGRERLRGLIVLFGRGHAFARKRLRMPRSRAVSRTNLRSVERRRRRSNLGDIDDSFGKGLWGFLRQIVPVFRLAFGQSEPPAIIVDDDGDMIRVFE